MRHTGMLVMVALTSACSGDALTAGGRDDPGSRIPANVLLSCNLVTSFLFDGGVARDGIPALVNPILVDANHTSLLYLDEYAAFRADFPGLPDVRVVGMVVNGQAVAFPLNILWWHEIINIDLGGRRLAVTYCPLTGSALVFDGTAAGTKRFGVSGLLYLNNLVMFDGESESLWPQMLAEARCGSRSGVVLESVAHIEIRWEEWKARQPNTLVVSSQTDYDRPYNRYPYDLYEVNDRLPFSIGDLEDPRRFAKERVLGIPEGNGGLAFPFGELEARGALAAIEAQVGSQPLVVLWDRAAQAAGAYERITHSGDAATMRVEEGRLVDAETGSVWNVEGVAVEGPRTGERLVPIAEAFVAYWFAWAAFHPATGVWLN